ncbi:MAG: hypothetical protein ACOH2E_02900 [Candidatus Paracaedibacter sp.]
MRCLSCNGLSLSPDKFSSRTLSLYNLPLTRPQLTLRSASPTRGEVLNTSVHLTSPLVGEAAREQREQAGEG